MGVGPEMTWMTESWLSWDTITKLFSSSRDDDSITMLSRDDEQMSMSSQDYIQVILGKCNVRIAIECTYVEVSR